MNAGMDRLRGWMRLFRIDVVPAAAGLPLAGFLLVFPKDPAEPVPLIPLTAACVSAFFAFSFGSVARDLASMNIDARSNPSRPIPSGAVGVKQATLASLIAILFALIPAGISLELLLCAILLAGGRYVAAFHLPPADWKGRLISAALPVIAFASGVLVASPHWKSGSACVLVPLFAAGLFAHAWGFARLNAEKRSFAKKRPGGRLLLLGALLCYCVVFAVVASTRFRGFSAIVSGLLAALSGGVFLIASFFTARFAKAGAVPAMMHPCLLFVARFLFLIEAAVAASVGCPILALALILACVVLFLFGRVSGGM